MALGFPKNEPKSVPGKGLSEGGKVEGLQSMHKPADSMASHDMNTKSGGSVGSTWPASPAHDCPITLENAESVANKITPNDSNMNAGLGPIEVPGTGL